MRKKRKEHSLYKSGCGYRRFSRTSTIKDITCLVCLKKMCKSKTASEVFKRKSQEQYDSLPKPVKRVMVYQPNKSSKPRQVWIMWDLSNGHTKRRCYLWIFPSRQDALEHRRKQHRGKFHARLSMPQKSHVRMKSILNNQNREYFRRNEVIGLKQGHSHPKW